MSSPLSQITFNQEAGYLSINLVSGDDLSVVIELPFDITSYTFNGSVIDTFGNVIADFDVTRTQLTPTGIVTATLTGIQTALIIPSCTYYLQWNNVSVRTFLAGPIVAVAK